jgi:trimeric autotransporter adhesin
MALHVFVIKETELEDPQDLRAEIGKCPISTNERKKMSTKTLRKRIALVAVAALGAGLLSVVAVPSANAANEGEIGTSAAAGSVGVLAASLVATNTTNTATILSTGKLGITSTGGASSYFVVTGGAYISQGITAAATLTNAGTVSGDQKSYTSAGANNVFFVVPTGAVGSTFTITGYASDGGALVSQTTVTIAGASVAGVVSPAESGVFWNTSAGEVTADASGASAAAPVTPLYLDIDLADAYGTAITGTTGALVVTATAGANVGLGTSATTGTFSTAVSSRNPSADFVKVTEATAGAGWKGTVTVTYNGVVVATKSGSIAGYASKITLSRNSVATAATSTADAVRFKATDTAGNSVQITASSLTMKSSSNTDVVSNVVGATNQNISAGTLADGKATVTCGNPGTSSVVMQYVTPAGVTVVTAPVTVICGAGVDTYTASWDKASYSQGEIATLTVSFKDIYGAPAASASAATATSGSPSVSNEVISAPMMTLIGSVSSAALYPDENGQITYKYSVGTSSGITAGAYQASVSFPTVNAVNGAAQAVGYTITSAAGVSNADVLKAIVSLIASINKQIAALQKALLKKK